MPENRQQQEQNGKLVKFPLDGERLPPQRLPKMVGKIDEGHPLLKPLVIAFILLAIILGIQVLVSIYSPNRQTENRSSFAETFRESGTITYGGERIDGWFLDSERQHFLSADGQRYTYVNPHERDGKRISGHWRIIN